MLAELQNSIGNDVLTGLAQAVGAIALCAVVVALCGWQSIHVEREAAVSMARGLVQMVLVGVVLALLLHGSLLIGSLILFMMTIAAAVTAARRLKGMDGALLLCFWSIATGAGIIIAGFDPEANVSWVRATIFYCVLEIIYEILNWITTNRFDPVGFLIAVIVGAMLLWLYPNKNALWMRGSNTMVHKA